MTQTPRDREDRDKHNKTAKRRTLPDVDEKDGDEVPQAGLPTEDVELDSRPLR
jgi:hypothetical protein